MSISLSSSSSAMVRPLGRRRSNCTSVISVPGFVRSISISLVSPALMVNDSIDSVGSAAKDAAGARSATTKAATSLLMLLILISVILCVKFIE